MSKYSREELTQQLQALGKKLGHSPTSDDIVEATGSDEVASHPTFVRHFGSFGEALRKAGFYGGKKHVRRTQKQLLDDLRALAQTLGKVPTKRELDENALDGSFASSGTYMNQFGTWVQALEKAGLL